MKNLLIIICLLVSIASCSKEPKIKLKNITQTDENCNIIGSPAEGQWGIYNLSNLSSRDNEVIFGNNTDNAGLIFLVAAEGYNINDYNLDCPLDFEFDLLVCPNPTNLNNSGNRVGQTYFSTLSIEKVFFGSVDRKNRAISVSAGYGFGGDYFFPNYDSNHTRYYLILTTDSCAFFGKGDIIIEK